MRPRPPPTSASRPIASSSSANRSSCETPSLLRLFLGGSLLLRPVAAQDALERVVAFVTRVLEDHAVFTARRKLDGPRSREGSWILDRHAVLQDIGSGAGEALDQPQMFAGAPVIDLVVEVGGLDHQRVAVPAPD